MTDHASTQVLKAMGDVALDQMMAKIVTAVPRAQLELDLVSIETAMHMSGRFEAASGEVIDSTLDIGGERLSLLELGFTPTFYQFAETTIEVKVSMTMTHESASSSLSSHTQARAKGNGLLGAIIRGPRISASASTVSTASSAKYGFQGAASSMWRTRLVPLPAPPALMDRLNRLRQAEQ